MSRNTRKTFRKALKNNYSFDLLKITENTLKNNFVNLYFKNMKKVNASEYYYFNNIYFNSLEKRIHFIYSLVNHKKIYMCVFIYINTFYQ